MTEVLEPPFLDAPAEKKSDKPKYDATIPQEIWMEISKGGNVHDVAHKLSPLSDERYFKFIDEVNESAKRERVLTTEAYAPKVKLWQELVIERIGYKDKPNWKEKTVKFDCIQAINALLSFEPVIENHKTDELLDDDEVTPVKFKCVFNRQMVEITHHFAEPTKEQFDEYFAIISNQPQKNALASMVKKSDEKRFFDLYQSMNAQSADYANNAIPAWHKFIAARTFLEMQFQRLGKL